MLLSSPYNNFNVTPGYLLLGRYFFVSFIHLLPHLAICQTSLYLPGDIPTLSLSGSCTRPSDTWRCVHAPFHPRLGGVRAGQVENTGYRFTLSSIYSHNNRRPAITSYGIVLLKKVFKTIVKYGGISGANISNHGYHASQINS